MAGATVVAMLIIDLVRRQHVPEASPWGLTGPATLGMLALLAAGYGVGSKISDLTQEHGLEHPRLRRLGYTMAAVTLVSLMAFSAGATLVAREVLFHGALKGKADTRSHLWAMVVSGALLLGLFALFPGSRVDWLAVVVLLVSGTAWMWLNNRVLRLGDTLFHMVRGDTILLLGLLAVIDARWLPLAVAISAEHLAYATTKLVAMRSDWYRDEARHDEEDDWLGLAFHRGPSSTNEPRRD